MRRHLLWSLLALSCACGSSHSAPSDAGVDSTTVDAAADASTDAALPACPADPFAAVGTACTSDGQTCGDCPGDPCSGCTQFYCNRGLWERIDAHPAPCHECGGAGPCVSISEYCDIARSDVGGVPDSYRCLPLPDACLGDLSCTCLQMSVAADACMGMGTTGLTVEHFGG